MRNRERTADGEAAGVLVVLRACGADLVVEVVVRIEDRVAGEHMQVAVKLASARARDQLDLCVAAASVLRAIAVAQHLQLLGGLDGRVHNDVAAGIMVQHVGSVERPCVLVRAQTVDSEIGVVGLAARRDAARVQLVGGSSVNYSGLQLDDLFEVARVEREIFHLGTGNYRVHGAVFKVRSQIVRGIHGDGVAAGTDRHLNVDLECGGYVDLNMVDRLGRESGRRYRYGIIADLQERRIVSSVAVCLERAHDFAGIGIGDDDGSDRYTGSTGVGHSARDFAGDVLRVRRQRQQRQQNQHRDKAGQAQAVHPVASSRTGVETGYRYSFRKPLQNLPVFITILVNSRTRRHSRETG